MNARRDQAGRLIISADDWGYSEPYNAGILEAARAAAVDAVSAMVLRPACNPGLGDAEVEIGLHVEAPAGAEPAQLAEAPRRQAGEFEHIFGHPPTYIDGHHHCHAAPPLADPVEELALELGVPVRAIGEEHRRRLRRRGIRCADRLVGRTDERDPAIPVPIAATLAGGKLPAGVSEWVVHPGHPDPRSDSNYDAGRGRDLAVLLELAGEEALRAARITHAALSG